MRVLVTGGCGFIGSRFVKRLAAAGDSVVVLDKLTYAGNPANLEGAPHEFVEGDIADRDAVERAGEGCDVSPASSLLSSFKLWADASICRIASTF